jgi:protein-disulfide isomerase
MISKTVFAVWLVLPALSGIAAAAPSDAPSGSGAVVVEIDGAKLTLADLERRHPGSLFQARNTYYQAERKAVEEFVDDYLLQREADKEHLTVEQLLDRHVKSVLPPDPSEESLRVYYEGVDTTEPYDKVRGQIIDHIRQTRYAKAKAAYVASLRSQAHVAIRLGPPRTPISLKDTPVRGAADAPLTLVEYADYECPYCQQIQPALDKLEAEYKGKLAFAYKDVPLPMHSHAEKAAEAAHCAGAQGKFWEYHDLLFSSRQLDLPQLKEHARALKLDQEAFDKCLELGQESAAVKEALSEGQALQLQGTPSFFINGRFFSGNMSYEQLRAIVEEELGASAAPNETAAHGTQNR